MSGPQDQTTNILQAVSWKYWTNDVNHPAPSNDINVLIGFPAYPSTSFRTNTAEKIFHAVLRGKRRVGGPCHPWRSLHELWFGRDWLDAW